MGSYAIVLWNVFTLLLLIRVTFCKNHNNNNINDGKCKINITNSTTTSSTLCPTGCYSVQKTRARTKHMHHHRTTLSEARVDLMLNNSNKYTIIQRNDTISLDKERMHVDPVVSVICKIIPYGYYSPTNDDQLYKCPAGSFSNVGSSSCTVCPIGTYTFRSASGSCLYCPYGQSTINTGSTYCLTCIIENTTTIKNGTVSTVNNSNGNSSTNYENTLMTSKTNTKSIDTTIISSNQQQQYQQRCIVTDYPSTQQPMTSPSDVPSYVPSMYSRSTIVPTPSPPSHHPQIDSSSSIPLPANTSHSPSTLLIPSLSNNVQTMTLRPSIHTSHTSTQPIPNKSISQQPQPQQQQKQKIPVSFPGLQIFDNLRKPSILKSNSSTSTNTSNTNDDGIVLLNEKQQQIVKEKRQKTILLIIQFTVGVTLVLIVGCIAAWYKQKYCIKPKMEYIKLQFLFHRPIPNPPPTPLLLYTDTEPTTVALPNDTATTAATASSVSSNNQYNDNTDNTKDKIYSSLLSIVDDGSSDTTKMISHRKSIKHKTY